MSAHSSGRAGRVNLAAMLEDVPNNGDVVAGNKPHCRPADALAVLTRLREAGHAALFAGGCVRDQLLGREPKDWDVATDAPPNRVRAIFSNTQAVGAAFGVILVRYHGSTIEVATFRADSEYVDGRHPASVRFTTAEEDAKRRDFTINGLFLDPLKRGSLQDQVIDYVGGREDLAAGRIRAIGDAEARFCEDHLRLLRAVRFAARFGFAIEPMTAGAIRRHGPQLVRISPERIAEELRIMLTPPTRAVAYRLLDELGLRPLLFRFLELPAGGGRFAKSTSAFAELAPGAPIGFGLAMAGAAIDHYLWHGPSNADVRRLFERPIAQKIVRSLRQSLKISNDESDDLLGALCGLEPLLNDAMPGVAVMKRFLARTTSAYSQAILEACRRIGALAPVRAREIQNRLAELQQGDFAPAPFVTGDDLTAAGLTPGPMFKRVLDAAYDAQLEDRVSSREMALQFALQLSRAEAE